MIKYRKITDISLITDTISKVPILIYRYRRYFEYIEPSLRGTACMPVDIQSSDTVTAFKSRLKTYLFKPQPPHIRQKVSPPE